MIGTLVGIEGRKQVNQAWKRSFQLVVVTTVALFIGFNEHAIAGPVVSQSVQSLVKNLSVQGARISRNPRSGRVVFIGTDHGRGLMLPGMATGLLPGDNARTALVQYAALFGIKNPASELKTMKQLDTPDGRSLVRYQQIYQGLPVIGGEMIVNLDSLGRMSSMNGEIRPDLNLDPTPLVTSTQAQEKAVSSVAALYNIDSSKLNTSPPVLSVYAPELIGPAGPGPVLVWRMNVVSDIQDMIDEFVLVDARRGAIALHFTNVEHAKSRKTYDVSAVTQASDLPGVLLCSESTADNCTSGADLDADTASLYAGDTYDFYYNNFGRDSIDDKGMTISSGVHFDFSVAGGSCPNAGWSDTYKQMFYCNGMPEGDDVDAHELTHGVTSRTSGLFYWYQSGAINESMSDVFGEFIDLTNGHGASDIPGLNYSSGGTRWEIGEDSAIGVIRDMWDPTRFGDPDKMTSANYYTGTSDNGGVHTNSGVNNHAAALMVDGGTFNTVTVTGIGVIKAAQIYYEAQTRLLTSGSDYYDLYNALYQGCLNLVGTHGISNTDCGEVQKATQAVEMDQEPVINFNPDAGFCPTAGNVPNNLFFDGFEGNLGNWTKGGSNANSVWSVDAPSSYFPGPYAASGSHSLYADDLYTSNDSYIAMTNGVNIPSGGLYMRFDQAWGFYPGGNGGARLEYSIDNGAFNDASSLFDAGQDYNGTASSGVFAGQSAWINNSHGYVSSRYHITTNVGSDIRFRYRLGTGTLFNYGWWIDNVRLYTCVANSPPTAPDLVYPGDGSTNVDSTADTVFKWNPSTDADGDTINYNLKVCTDPGFASCVTDITKSNATATFVIAGLGNGFSLIFAGMLVAGRKRKLGAAIVILSIVATMVGCGGGGSGTTALTYTVPASTLSPGTTYYWHVTATDSNLASTTSVDWSFTTAP